MRPIDATELLENLWRADVSTREKIAEIIENQPTIRGIELCKLIAHYDKLSNEYMQKAEHYKEMAYAYATAADSIRLAQKGCDPDAES